MDFPSFTAPAAKNSAEWAAITECVFVANSKREALLVLEKLYARMHYRISQSRFLDQPMLMQLLLLQDAVAECRYRIRSTHLEDAIQVWLRELRGEAAATDTPKGDPRPGGLAACDAELVQAVPRVITEVDSDRFRSALSWIISIDERLPENAKQRQYKKFRAGLPMLPDATRAKRRMAGYFRRQQLLHDNIFHATKLFSILVGEGYPETTSAQVLDGKWLDILSILAICLGCTSLPSFFLSTLDRLFDDIRAALGCQSSIYSVVDGYSTRLVERAPCGMPRACVIDRDPGIAQLLHRRQQLFREITCFVRGCAIGAVATTLPQAPRENSTQRRLRTFSRLLSWRPTCVICRHDILLPQQPRPRDVVVGVKDRRQSDFELLAAVSDNRLDIYDCPAEFTAKAPLVDIHPTFFYHFADLYHPACKPARGKHRERHLSAGIQSAGERSF